MSRGLAEEMGLFLKVTFGTVVVLVTLLALWMMAVGAAIDDGELVAAGATVWGVFAGFVLASWAIWNLGRWAVRRRRRA